jgi:hypothetical protein
MYAHARDEDALAKFARLLLILKYYALANFTKKLSVYVEYLMPNWLKRQVRISNFTKNTHTV